MDALATTIEPLALPNKLAAEYLAKWDIAAIAILAPPPGLPCQPSATIDIAEALAGVRKSWPADLEQPALVRAWWTSGIRPAQSVLSLVLACDLRGYPLDHGRLGVPISKLSEAITSAAARLRIGLTDYEVGLARTGAATERIEHLVDEAQVAGILKPFNQEYRRRRQATRIQGLPYINYSTARSRLEAVLARAASGKPVGDIIEAALAPPAQRNAPAGSKRSTPT